MIFAKKKTFKFSQIVMDVMLTFEDNSATDIVDIASARVGVVRFLKP